jgi:hypothetical protein
MVRSPSCGFSARVLASRAEEAKHMNQPRLLIAGWVTLAMALASGVSGETAQKGLIDLPKLVGALDLTERGVRKWLDELGVAADATPTERLLAVNVTGGRLFERHGGSSSVVVDPELDDALHQSGRAIVLVHNHPTNVGLSVADMGQLAKPGVAAIVAIGHDGSVFIASAGPRFDRDFFEERQCAVASADVAKRLRVEWASRHVSVAASDAHFNHLVTLVLAKAGIVQYWFSLRGTDRGSYELGRAVFGYVVVGAAARLRQKSK